MSSLKFGIGWRAAITCPFRLSGHVMMCPLSLGLVPDCICADCKTDMESKRFSKEGRNEGEEGVAFVVVLMLLRKKILIYLH